MCTYYTKEKILDTRYLKNRPIVDRWSIILVLTGYIIMFSYLFEIIYYTAQKLIR